MWNKSAFQMINCFPYWSSQVSYPAPSLDTGFLLMQTLGGSDNDSENEFLPPKWEPCFEFMTLGSHTSSAPSTVIVWDMGQWMRALSFPLSLFISTCLLLTLWSPLGVCLFSIFKIYIISITYFLMTEMCLIVRLFFQFDGK